MQQQQQKRQQQEQQPQQQQKRQQDMVRPLNYDITQLHFSPTLLLLANSSFATAWIHHLLWRGSSL